MAALFPRLIILVCLGGDSYSLPSSGGLRQLARSLHCLETEKGVETTSTFLLSVCAVQRDRSGVRGAVLDTGLHRAAGVHRGLSGLAGPHLRPHRGGGPRTGLCAAHFIHSETLKGGNQLKFGSGLNSWK